MDCGKFSVFDRSILVSNCVLHGKKNVDEAVEKLKAQGIEALGVVCHVSNEQQRKNLINKIVLPEEGGAQKELKDMTLPEAQHQTYSPSPRQNDGSTLMQEQVAYMEMTTDGNPPTLSPKALQTQESVLDKLWEIKVKATILLLKDASPHLTKGSSVVIISSIAGYDPPGAAMAMYGVTKTALLGLTKALAGDMAPDTRVNCVAPGFVPTNFASYITETDVVRKALEEKTLLNRLGTTGDMAAAAAFLASDDASYITGETIVVAGGMPPRL